MDLLGGQDGVPWSHHFLCSLREAVGSPPHSESQSERWALAAILHTRRMSINYKIRLWRSCVLSTLTYALHCLPLSDSHIRLLQRTMMKHIRALVSDQRFLTGTTHEAIMDRHHLHPVKEEGRFSLSSTETGWSINPGIRRWAVL